MQLCSHSQGLFTPLSSGRLLQLQVRRRLPSERVQRLRCASGSQETEIKASQEDRGTPKALLAGGAIGFGAAAFVALRVLSGAPSFENLERASIPLDTALQNGKPTVIEFYASWCNICRELLPDTLEVLSPSALIRLLRNTTSAQQLGQNLSITHAGPS